MDKGLKPRLTRPVMLRTTPQILEEFNRLSEVSGLSKSELFRAACLDYMARMRGLENKPEELSRAA
jgi:metal-responsive CopG/Arc/MetJ family transcriptional regulator